MNEYREDNQPINFSENNTGVFVNRKSGQKTI
jgi:hypothetical protein